ncbi:EamA family transporter [methanotrophic endosymbiont of Bathymodiolus puteoserpentis (Logatchev)]|jgi:drug/metabolite transporter (DMT)-like permease|uniref:EamA family transporter n=1 Tax=methanotrophic endosymbiont of Bathymodiolus puteoserpentis (Logatchev) TaxID=343235 RepID=UPI0013C942F1|nr:Permease of the drug/metabolite transporter (DMT) superfamily [methanotrophic endosymbiont of Bathymodiolus puteoserpentis (Logatchev)]
MIGYFYIFGTILFTVYGQLILKWRISHYGQLPSEAWDKVYFLAKLFLDPFLLSGFASTIIAAIFWIAAMTKFDISYAYPFMSAAFVLVLVLSAWLFKEPISLNKILGMVFIVIGIIITSRSV